MIDGIRSPMAMARSSETIGVGIAPGLRVGTVAGSPSMRRSPPLAYARMEQPCRVKEAGRVFHRLGVGRVEAATWIPEDARLAHLIPEPVKQLAPIARKTAREALGIPTTGRYLSLIV